MPERLSQEEVDELLDQINKSETNPNWLIDLDRELIKENKKENRRLRKEIQELQKKMKAKK
jgi:cell division septum initiation protein DivIVA